MSYEGLRLRVLKKIRLLFAKSRNKKLINKEFTIISNNCWGGMIYESYNLPKMSPTVGLFFMADDFIRFCSDIKRYNHSEQEAKEKWKRRCSRINLDKLIVKFNDQNGCCEEHARAFAAMPFEHKLFFTVHDWGVNKWDGYYKIKQHTKDDFVTASHEPLVKNRYVDLTKLINGL